MHCLRLASHTFGLRLRAAFFIRSSSGCSNRPAPTAWDRSHTLASANRVVIHREESFASSVTAPAVGPFELRVPRRPVLASFLRCTCRLRETAPQLRISRKTLVSTGRVAQPVAVRDYVHSGEYVLAQFEIHRRQERIQLFGFACADDWRRDGRLMERPGNRQCWEG